METNTQRSDAPPVIDLTSQTDVQYWCRIFDVSMAQLREAVHHAGHLAEEVQRYLTQQKPGA